jgi:hypothetical protein
MIAFTRSASIGPGKTANAIRFGHDVAKLIKDRHGITLELLMPIGGNPGRIAWHTRYENLAQWESLIGKLMADKDYMDLVAKSSDAFLAGSVHDDIWRTL